MSAATGQPSTRSETTHATRAARDLFNSRLVIINPDKLVFGAAVAVQRDAAIGRWPVIHRELVAARQKLAAGGRRCHDSYAVMLGIVILVNVAEDGQADPLQLAAAE